MSESLSASSWYKTHKPGIVLIAIGEHLTFSMMGNIIIPHLGLYKTLYPLWFPSVCVPGVKNHLKMQKTHEAKSASLPG